MILRLSLIALFSLLAFTASLGQDLFPEINAKYPNTDILLPEGYSYKILFSEGQENVQKLDGTQSKAKGKHDFLTFIPIRNDWGLIYVGHEDVQFDNILGDGGGGTVFYAKKQENGEWGVEGDITAVDFSGVGGTLNNCGGTYTSLRTILSAEEWDPQSNAEIYNEGRWISDTSDYNNRPRWMNFGWMVEVDPVAKKANRKLWQMGRFAHEDAILMDDHQTVYLTDDNSPAVWFKFVAHSPGDLTSGQLYAYTEEKKQGSNWIALPMDFNTMVFARDSAIARGATLFNRLEWVEQVGMKLYITETGRDKANWKREIDMGGNVASHLRKHLKNGTEISDPFGRVLAFDFIRDKFVSHIEGGVDVAKEINFTNPDALTQVELQGKTYLVIHEDIIGTSMGRSGDPASTTDDVYNEVFLLDMSIDNPQLTDLERLLIAPRGCETTGGYFNPEGDSFFLNIQDPDDSNPPPFNKSHTVVIQGFQP